MRLLFLTMIPSMTMAAEVGDGDAIPDNSFWKTIGNIFDVFSLLPDVWGLLIGIAIAAVILWIVSCYNKKRPTLDSTFAIILLTATGGFFWWCFDNNIILNGLDDLSKFGAWSVIFALCFMLANVGLHLLIHLLGTFGVININKVLHANRWATESKFINPFSWLWRLGRKIRGYCSKKDKEIAAQTLYFAAKAFNSMLTELDKIDSENNCPEFQLVISGDTELLRNLPSLPPYDILHFIELQSIWAKQFNAIQRKIQWKQSKREEEHKNIVEDRLPGAAHCTSCDESCAKELHQKLSATFDKWKIDAKYYSQKDNHVSGILMDQMVKNAINQWVKRLPSNNNHENYMQNTRAIRILFSTEKDLVDSAIQMAQSFSINFPLSKDEIRNVWIPTNDMLLFTHLEDWVNKENPTNWNEKFLDPPSGLGKNGKGLTPAQVVKNYVTYLTGKYDESIADPLDHMMRGLSVTINQEKDKDKFMYLFIGNRMEKKSYYQETPRENLTDRKRLGASVKHLAHLFLVLMALHHKEAVPLMMFFERVCEEKNGNKKEFTKNAEKFSRDCLNSVRNSIKRKLLA